MTDKTTEALKLAEEALKMYCEHGAIFKPNEALAAIREALADHVEQSLTMVDDHSGDANEMVYSKPSVFDGVCCGCSKKAADGYALYCVECWEKAEPVKQEPVAWVAEGKCRVGFGREEVRKFVVFDQTLPVGTEFYTTQPSVEAATSDEEMTKFANGYLAGYEDAKENAAKLIDNEEIHRGKWFAAAIRSMK